MSEGVREGEGERGGVKGEGESAEFTLYSTVMVW